MVPGVLEVSRSTGSRLPSVGWNTGPGLRTSLACAGLAGIWSLRIAVSGRQHQAFSQHKDAKENQQNRPEPMKGVVEIGRRMEQPNSTDQQQNGGAAQAANH